MLLAELVQVLGTRRGPSLRFGNTSLVCGNKEYSYVHGVHHHTSKQERHDFMQMPLKGMCHVGGVTVALSEGTVDSRTQMPPKGLP